MRGYDGAPPRRAKYLRDALHGSIVVEPHEVAFVDAPLFQRLRGILQHEKVGALLLQSPPLRRLFERADVDADAVVALITDDPAALAARGFPPYLASVISGPIDADKLDYFARDSLFSGVPAIL